jgi:DNA replication protein DnaC
MKSIAQILAEEGSGTLKDRMQPTSGTDGADGSVPGRRPAPTWGDGDPDCPTCGGVGWLRRPVEVGDPDFGRAFPCVCIEEKVAARRLAAVRGVSDLAAIERMTFRTFHVDAPGNGADARRSLVAAWDAAGAFADEPRGWLVLHGSYGCGKTHLAAAIVNERLARGGSAVFLVVPDLLDHLRSAYDPSEPESYDERFEAIRAAPLLVLDDLGAQAPTPWAHEKLFQLLNHRYNAELPTVITTNRSIEELDERLRSRLGHFGLVRLIEIKAIDYRGGVPSRGDALSTLDLYADMTFDTWDPRTGDLETEVAENLSRAFSLAREFADRPRGWLVFTGDHGCGKTHLAAAVANRFSTQGAVSAKTVFVTMPDLLDYLRATFSPGSRVRYDQRFDEIRESDMLVLDDIGTESATAWAKEKMFQILTYRYVTQLPTVLTMSQLIKDLHPWLRTRILDQRRCTIFEILAPPYGLRTVAGGTPERRRGRRGARPR